MLDPHGDRAIQEAIEQLAEAMTGQESGLDRQEVQRALRGTVEELMGSPGIEGDLPSAGEPPPEARRDSPPPGPPPDANPPA